MKHLSVFLCKKVQRFFILFFFSLVSHKGEMSIENYVLLLINFVSENKISKLVFHN